MWLNGLILLTILAIAKCSEAELTVEAAFQGRCGQNSPCEQLCYEIHYGMYECGCTEGYELDKNGYSCQEINSTFQAEDSSSKGEEDVLYQKGVSFSAKLDSPTNHNQLESGDEDDEDGDISETDDNKNNKNEENISAEASDEGMMYNEVRDIKDTTKAALNLNYLHSSNRTITVLNLSPTPTASYGNSDDDYYVKADMSVYDDVNNNRLNLRQYNSETYQSEMAQVTTSDPTTTDSERANGTSSSSPLTLQPSSTGPTEPVKTTSLEPCLLDCGSEGVCDYTDGNRRMKCLCPFAKTGKGCLEDTKVNTPRFTKKSWLAFPALRGAYKHVQLRVEFRPESFDGIILLTGERDDLTGDFMALLIHQGFIEFWFDCGSGTGSLRSKETVLLNQWNSVTIYRHRWDAWLVLNHETRVQGRSKGLFSRITFREPVFLGGTGNITGLAKRLPVYEGMVGCIRRFIANEHEYKFDEHPMGDVTKGFDIQDCTTDKCVKYPCQHGGKCLPSDLGAVCLCPLGFGGDLCEMRLDLQVPSFNGSSYLRYAPLGDSALIWLELEMIIKPHHDDGILLYSGHENYGDYIALSLNMGFVEFSFDLGSGPALVKSEFPLALGQWHSVKISRTARLAVLKVDHLNEIMTVSSNGFWHLSLPHSLFLGGIHNIQNLPPGVKERGSFVGCIQKVEINGRMLSIISEALGGTNVDNCPHACVARPCGPLSECVPLLDNYECRCSPFNAQCNEAEEVPLRQVVNNKGRKINVHHKHKTHSKHRNHRTKLQQNPSHKKKSPLPEEIDKKSSEGNNNPRNESPNYSTDSKNVHNDKVPKTGTPKVYKKLEFEGNNNEGVGKSFYVVDNYMAVDSEQLLKDDRNKGDRQQKAKLSNELGNENLSDMMIDKKDIHYGKHKSNDRLLLTETGEPQTGGYLFDGDEDYQTKEFIQDMERIMKNGNDMRLKDDNNGASYKKNVGACFTGTESYFHYNDAETMSHVISYKIDLNLRFKTNSNFGVILWSGRQSALDSDDFLSLGIENGYLHLRYNLGSGETNIQFNATKVSDGLWHRVRAMRNSQEGLLEVDGRKSVVQRSPGKLRQLNTDTGLYVGGMPNVVYYTRRRYFTGIVGCISEIVLAGEVTLTLDPASLGTAHNVEVGIL